MPVIFVILTVMWVAYGRCLTKKGIDLVRMTPTSTELEIKCMFDIKFIETAGSANKQHDSELGEIAIGEFSERFEIVLEYWNKSDYQRQWFEGLSRIVGGNTKSCLITSLTDPASANFIFWWLIYRDGTVTVFQNQILFLDELAAPFDVVNPYAVIPDRVQITEDGEKVSEWTAPITDLIMWLERHDFQ
jgi:hypothetical protein